MNLVFARLRRGAVRMRAFVAVAVVVAVTATLLVLYGTTTHRSDDPSLGDVLRAGVPEGASIPAYVQASRDRLDALNGDTEVYALISLTAYLTPDRLAPVLGAASVSSVFARVPLPATQTELVRLGAFRLPDDVVTGMDRTAQRKRTEAQHYRDLLATAGPELSPVYSTGAIVADQEAAAYQDHCACVYAAVVAATPAVLRAVAAQPQTRAVDPITDLQRLDRTVFLPPLPEQSTIAGPITEVPASAVASPGPS